MSSAINVPPFTSTFFRFLTASSLLILFTIKKYKRLSILTLRELLFIIDLSLTGIAGYSFFFSILKTATGDRTSMIIALNPLAITILPYLLFGERVTMAKILGVLLSLTGVLVVIPKGYIPSILYGKFGWGKLFILAYIYIIDLCLPF